VICENIGELEGVPALTSHLDRDVATIGGYKYIRLEDNQVEIHSDFRLFLFTSYSNPHFSPVVQAKAQLLNFTVTQEGLKAQLLGLVCRSECAKEEDEANRLKRQNMLFRKQKADVEREILRLLGAAGGDILEDETLVNSLDESKRITDDIAHKLAAARQLSERIEASRKAFGPVATHAARLYFAVQSLSDLDPMYQFSMRWFRELFKESLELHEDEQRERVPMLRSRQLKQRFLKLLYDNVAMGLFGHHQLAFAFLIATRVNETLRGALAYDAAAAAFRERLEELDKLAAKSRTGMRNNLAMSTSKRSETSRRSSQRLSDHPRSSHHVK
jgi:dynein heavy chain